MLLPPRKLPGWLNEAAAEAERELTAAEAQGGRAKSPVASDAPAVDESQWPTSTAVPGGVSVA
jgi:hypothetical protein